MRYVEFGVVCDRRSLGLGRLLLAKARDADRARALADERCNTAHPHHLVTRNVFKDAWSEPLETWEEAA